MKNKPKVNRNSTEALDLSYLELQENDLLVSESQEFYHEESDSSTIEIFE